MYCCDKDPVVLEAARARLKVYYKVLKSQNILKNINQMPPQVTSRELKSLWFVDEVEVGEDESVAGEGGQTVELIKWIQKGIIPKFLRPDNFKASKKWGEEEALRLGLELGESGVSGGGVGVFTKVGRARAGALVCVVPGQYLEWDKAQRSKSRRLVETVAEWDGKPIVFNMAWNHPAAFFNDGLFGSGDGEDSKVNCVLVENTTLKMWDPDYFQIRTLGFLPPGTELFLDYGETYWAGKDVGEDVAGGSGDDAKSGG